MSTRARRRGRATPIAAPDVLPIRASAPEPSTLALSAVPVEFQAAAGEGKRPSFSVVAYTGAVIQVSAFYSPVIVDLTGLRVDGQEIPVFRGHDDSRIVGQTDSVKIGPDVRITGTITGDNDDAREVVSQAKNGFRWRASIGANILRREFLEPGNSATVNGREVSGPLVIAREAQLMEVSFVPIGADNQTSADVAASNPPGTHQGTNAMSFEQWLQAKGYDPAAIGDALRTALKAAYDADPARERAAPSPTPTPAPGPTPTPIQAGGNNPPAPTPAPAPDSPARTLDQILAEHRAEEERVATITREVEESIRARPTLRDEFGRIGRAAIEAKTSIDQFRLTMLRLRAEVGPAPGGFAIHVHDGRAGASLIQAAICQRGRLPGIEKHFDQQTLNAAQDTFPGGLGLVEALTIAAKEHGWTGHSWRSDLKAMFRHAFGGHRGGAIHASGFSTLDIGGILGNAANKFYVQHFMAYESAWRMIAKISSVNDFKTRTSYALTGDAKYEKIGPGGEIKHATLGEESYTIKADSYGKMFAITYEDIINDDLGALTDVPARLGRGAALALNEIFWAEFLDNATFFTAGNDNYFEGANSALSIDSLTVAEQMFFDQVDPDGNPLGVAPKFLLVPNGLNALASQIMRSTELRDTTEDTKYATNNPHAGKWQVVRSSYLSNTAFTGHSTTAWYMLADPMDLPVIEIAFLFGRDVPSVESADADFNTLGVQFRGTHFFGVNLQEKRGGVKSKGAA